jgi:protein required for attachment to host cells
MNTNTLVVIADAARARLFRIATSDHPRANVQLREAESLVNPEARVKEVDRHSGSYPAAAHTGQLGRPGQGHTLNDHREAHAKEAKRRFAKSIARAIVETAAQGSNNPVLVVATHALHASLMNELARELPNHIYVRSDVAELSEMPPSALLPELEKRGLLAR